MSWPVLVVIVLLLLLAIAAKLKQSGSLSAALPYSRKQALFSPAERSFLGVLEQSIGNHYRVFGKVRIADVIEAKRGLNRADWQRAFNRINAKHFDFVLCDKDELAVVCVIELNDKSHQKRDRQQRDAFVMELCRAVGLPFLQVQTTRAYSVQELRTNILAVTQLRLEPSLSPRDLSGETPVRS
jgi:hypothetical protein